MSDWVPAGSVAYDVAFVDGDVGGDMRSTVMSDGTVPFFSTRPHVKPEAKPKAPERSDKKCVGNDNTCGGWKARGTDYCIGHLNGMAREGDDGDES